MMARVFVSHAAQDLTIAATIRIWLRDAGHQVFLDRDLVEGIQVGEGWKRRLHRELRAADAVVCVVTAAYTVSQWCAVEAGIADMLGCPLLPVRAEPLAASALLDGLQYTDFQADRDRARDELLERLRGVDAAGGFGWPDDRSPFPGLRPFEVGMARVFCGRSEEVRLLTGRLRSLGDRATGGLLLVVGASGCGKSSLVRAGLLARMAGEPGWEVVAPFMPGGDPVTALGRALAANANRAGLSWTVENTCQVLASGDGGLVRLAEELLVTNRGPARERLMLIVDQGEELFTRSSEAGRSQFARLLREGLAGPVRAVATFRSEFCDRLLALPEVAEIDAEIFPLRPLGRHMLRRVVEEPAELAGLKVDPELVDRLVADTADGEALPLLAFTLHELADGLTRGGELAAGRYHALGGVQGALARHADATLGTAAQASTLDAEQVLAGLTRLAILGSSGEPTGRRVTLASFGEPLRTAFATFIEARLLIISAEPDDTWVSVAHEALFTVWPPLATALDARTTALREARVVEHAAAEWRRNKDTEHYLWNTNRLHAALTALRLPTALEIASSALTAETTDLDLDGRRFLLACISRAQEAHRRERRRRTRAVSVLLALLALALVLIILAALLAGRQWE